MSHTATTSKVPIKSITALRNAVAALNAKGITCSIEQNTTARLYYADQIERHIKRAQDQGAEGTDHTNPYVFNSNPEILDYVVRVPEAFYDIGLLRRQDGSYVPVFDDYNHPVWRHSIRGNQKLSNVLGARFDTPTQHWSGLRDNTDVGMNSIGQFLQEYSRQSILEVAIAQGYSVAEERTDETGHLHITVNTY